MNTGAQAKRKKEIDEAIDEVVRTLEPGETLSHKEIARRVGCSHGLIFLIEKSALKKLKKALHQYEDYSPVEKRHQLSGESHLGAF